MGERPLLRPALRCGSWILLPAAHLAASAGLDSLQGECHKPEVIESSRRPRSQCGACPAATHRLEVRHWYRSATKGNLSCCEEENLVSFVYWPC